MDMIVCIMSLRKALDDHFKMLLAKGKVTKEMIAMLSTWRHSGLHVF